MSTAPFARAIARRIQVAAVGFRYRATDGQATPVPPRPRYLAVSGPVEPLEDVRQVLCGDAISVVGHLKLQPAMPRRHRQFYVPARGRVPQRVGQQVA